VRTFAAWLGRSSVASEGQGATGLAKLRQFYGGTGVPVRVDRGAGAPSVAWRSHRARLRAWLGSVPDCEWGGPTRCALWDMTALVRHLVSGSQFLGYTLHKANRGIATEVLRGFDTQRTALADAARFGQMTPDTARELLASKDASVAAEFVGAEQGGWSAPAEAPPGHLPAHMAVNHFLFDSWVHEYDLMLPRGEIPAVDRLEAEVAVSYLIGLASVQAGSTAFLDLRLTSPDLRIGLSVAGGVVQVTLGSAPEGAAVIESEVVDLVDRATGRQGGPVRGDRAALAVLDCSAKLLAG
jgi:uncharacterized protein (TIGR03083 family)